MKDCGLWEKKLRASEGRGMGDWDRPMMGIKEGTYCMVHWVLYANNESWNITSNLRMYFMMTNITKVSSESKLDVQYASYQEEESILILNVVLAGLSIELAWDTWTEKNRFSFILMGN